MLPKYKKVFVKKLIFLKLISTYKITTKIKVTNTEEKILPEVDENPERKYKNPIENNGMYFSETVTL